MNVTETLYRQIANGAFALHTGEEIARKLKIKGKEKNALLRMLESLVEGKRLFRDSAFRYGTKEQFRAVEGTISGNERGFGFFVAENKGVKDLFIPRRALKGALHGDRVLAFSVGGKRGDEGEVLSILSRGITRLVGTFHAGRRNGYLYPDDRKYAENVYIPAGCTLDCKDGMKAVARISDFDGNSPVGEIVEILGSSGDFTVEENALICAHELREDFPDEVIQAAEKEALAPILPENRLDLRDELIITVDGEDTRDIDDAISVKKQGKNFILGVHIADVSNYVKEGGAIDKEAYLRGTSVYFPDRVLPMLPTALSNNICSLNEGVDRYALSCIMTVSPCGQVLHAEIAPSIIHSAHRMTYTEISAIAKGEKQATEKYPDLVEFVSLAMTLTGILKRRREDNGCVSLDVKEVKILYENGEISIPEYKLTAANDMIEQFMVLANESVASFLTQVEMPCVYRVHERPSPEKANAFAQFLCDLGIPAKFDAETVEPKDYKKVLSLARSLPVYSIVNRVMLRSMMKACYSPENLGHFGLASKCYCHFTSPIRRYPDLVVHRMLKRYFAEGKLNKDKYLGAVKNASVQACATEKNAEEAERDVDALYIAHYMKKHLGESYPAVISGVTSFGIFAELDNAVEGLIPLETLPEDSYLFYEEKFVLRGTRNTFRLGQKINIKVASVDESARRVFFVLNEENA